MYCKVNIVLRSLNIFTSTAFLPAWCYFTRRQHYYGEFVYLAKKPCTWVFV